MKKTHAWNPADSRDADPRQRPPGPAETLPDGTVRGGLWANSEGPYRHETGGAGGEPEGHSLPIRRVSWD
jgi:hypothetical protein